MKFVKTLDRLKAIETNHLTNTKQVIEKTTIANSMVDEGELLALVRSLIYSKPVKDELIIELGTYSGRTAAVLSMALLELKLNNQLVCVDNFSSKGSSEKKWEKNTKEFANNSLVIDTTKNFLTNSKKNSAAMIFVDAEHDYKNAYHDIKKSMSIVRKNGVIFVDDYGHAYPGVIKAVDALLMKNLDYKALIISNLYVAFERIV